MSKEADEVTRLVEQYEEQVAEDPDAQQVRALVQGMLAGAMIEQMRNGGLRVVDVDIAKDDEGIYEHHFVVHMASGIRIRVSCEVEK